MIRSIVILGLGALTGVLLVLLANAPSPQDPSAFGASPVESRRANVAAARSRFDEALQQLGVLANDLTDPAALEAEVGRAAAALSSPRSELRLKALLVRLAEIDPLRVVRLAERLGLGRHMYEPAFKRFAELDPEAALAAVEAIDHPGLSSALALELLDALGGDRVSFDRVAAALPESNAVNFQLAVVMRRVDTDPVAALQDAVTISDSAVRRTAVERIAYAWGSSDGAAAMAQLEAIPDRAERLAFFNLAMTWWTRSDPIGAFRYAVTADEEYLRSSGLALGSIAGLAPAEVLALAHQMPAWMREQLEPAAMANLAAGDPAQALAAAVTMAPGVDRENYVRRTAGHFARRDPDAAVAWARSQPNARELLVPVLAAVLDVDFDRAVAVAFEERDNPELMRTLAVGAIRYPDRVPGLAGRMLDVAGPKSPALRQLLSGWVDARPSAALEWALAHDAVLDTTVASRLAQGLAATDVDAAMAAMRRVPDAYRENWFTGVASAYARRDAVGALRWVRGYRGQPGFDEAAMSVLAPLVSIDPVAAADLVVDVSDADAQRQAASGLARGWAAHDPRAAAQWAERLAVNVRSPAFQTIAAQWAVTDAAEARRWVLRLAGEERDTALAAFVTAPGALDAGRPEELFAAFGNADRRQRAAAAAARQVATRDPDRARELVASYVTDPALRAQTEALIDAVSSGWGVNVILPR